VLAVVSAAAPVVIQVPDGVPGCAAMAAQLARELGGRGLRVDLVDDDALRRTVVAARRAQMIETDSPRARFAKGPPRTAVLVGALSSLAALLVAAALDPDASGGDDTAWLVEGRVAVEVPAHWAVERLTSGPGSARVQVISPSDALMAVQFTQARVRGEETLGDTAAVLKSAFDAAPRGAFVDFEPAAERTGRSVVSYREQRTALAVDWVVWIDRGVRIAVGCQHALDRHDPAPACERAVQSAHTVP
jgi:type VII secretion-associated protein (TIGR03931 family)